jgi:hypothetical protein
MIVVSDTTAHTTLIKAGLESLLPQLFDRILIPEEVKRELLVFHSGLPDGCEVRPVSAGDLLSDLMATIDAGEAEAFRIHRRGVATESPGRLASQFRGVGHRQKDQRAAGMDRGASQSEVRRQREPADPPISSTARQGSAQGGAGLEIVKKCCMTPFTLRLTLPALFELRRLAR